MDSDFEWRVLEALVTGYAVRAGLKDRFRSLDEYEIARRSGLVGHSYAAFEASSERAAVQQALASLQRRGLASLARSSGRYDTYLPTPQGERVIQKNGRGTAPTDEATPRQAPTSDRLPAAATGPNLEIRAQLDEVIHLLRSINQKLDRLPASGRAPSDDGDPG